MKKNFIISKLCFLILVFYAQIIFSQTNISLNKTSTASGGNASSQAFDGDLDTAWNAVGYAPAWISVDLGSISNVNHIVFNVSQTPDGDTTHYVYSSIDGINWQQVDNFNFYTSNHQEFTRSYTNLNGIRYLKFLTTSSPSWVSWYEISVFGTQEPIIPMDNIMAYYPFNGNAQNTIADNYHGTVYGATPTADRYGNCNSALNFNGINNYIEYAYDSNLHPNHNQKTYSFWAKFNNSDPNNLLQFQNGDADYSGGQFKLEMNSIGSFVTYFHSYWGYGGGSLASYMYQTTSNFNSNIFHLFTFVIDNTNVKYYLDGILIGEKNWNLPYLPYNTNFNFQLGRYYNSYEGGYAKYFNGVIDEFRIYNTALSQQQVTDLYNAEKPSNLNSQPGITVLVHGFQLTGGGIGGTLSPIEDFEKMGADIIIRAGGGIMYTNNPETGQLEQVPNTGSFPYPLDSNKEIVLVYNWGDLSNNGVTSTNFAGNGFLEAASDNLLATMLKLVNPNNIPMSYSIQQFLNKPKHLIGHSRGTILLLQTLHRFANYFPNTSFEQVTLLDPHPATVFGDMVSTYNNAPLSLPSIYGVCTDCHTNWSSTLLYGCNSTSANIKFPFNVKKADNYYRTDDEFEGLGEFGQFDGLPLMGNSLFNRKLNNSVLNIGSPTFGGTHSGVHLWYRGTIDTNEDVSSSVNYTYNVNPISGLVSQTVVTDPNGVIINFTSAQDNTNTWYNNASTGMANNFMQNECRTSTGFSYSRIGGRYNQLPLIPESYKLSITELNQALAEREGVLATNPNGIAPHNVFNGDFHYNNDAGWTKNGSSGVNVLINNQVATINHPIGTSGQVFTALKHSLMYFGGINEDYKYLKIEAKANNNNPLTGKGVIKFYDDLGNEISSSSFDLNILNNASWKTLYFPLPEELKAGNTSDGKVGTFGIFGLDNNSSIFDVDNIELLQCTPISSNLYIAMPDPSTLNFADIDSEHWAKEGIYKSRNYGLFRGTSPTTFTPNTSLTKAEAITVLVRAGIKLGIIPTYNTTGIPYADVDNCNQFFPYIQTAKNLGHLEFTSNFNPNTPITVAQLCVYMDKILQINLHDWNASTPNTPWVLAPTSQYIQSQLSQIIINQPEPEQNAAMRRILHCIDVVKNDNIIDSYRTQNVWTLKDVENINISSGQPIEVDGTATVTRARMAVASANLFRFVYKKLNNGVAPAGRMANQTNTATNDPSLDDFIGIGNTFDNKDIPATDTPEAPTQIIFDINSGETLNLMYQSDNDSAGNPQFFYWSMNKNVDNSYANLTSVPINNIQNHRKVSFTAPIITTLKTWYLYSYVANNKGKIKETIVTINVKPSGTLSNNETNKNLDDVVVYPNPFYGIFYVKSDTKKIEKILLYDSNGKLIKEEKPNNTTTNYTFHAETLPSGVYMLVVVSESGRETFKVIKK